MIEKIGEIEAVSPEACKIEVFHQMEMPGLELVIIDKDGHVEHGNRAFSRPGRAEMTVFGRAAIRS